MQDPDAAAFLKQMTDLFLSDAGAEVCDVTILTRDGERLPACRALLAIRSSYFKKLFFSDFREKHAKEVSIGFSARVLRTLLEFAYSGRSRLTERITANYRGNKDMPYVDVADLVDLTAALDYCEMDAFRKICLDLLIALGPRYASTSCTALEAITKNHSPALFDPVKAAFMKDVLSNPRASFKVPDSVISRMSRRYTLGKVQQQYGILCLSEATLAEVLRGDFQPDDQEYLFQAVYFWATEGDTLRSDARSDDARSDTSVVTPSREGSTTSAKADARWQAARKMVRHIDFRAMRVMFLRDYVEPTAMLERDTLLDILWFHSMKDAEVVQPQEN